MSTQHPDNVQIPFFSEQPELKGEDEIQEAFYVFTHLGCEEQMWDYEGKEVDNFVVKKLLSTYDSTFRQLIIGEQIFITPRILNPSIEKNEAKILLETLGSIPRSYDAAILFNPDSPPPIFEVILPMTVSAEELNHVYYYYKQYAAAANNRIFPGSNVTIGEWLGKFRPETINVIPLFESVDHMLTADQVMEAYLRDKNFDDHRVFLARSDPAMNSGLVSTVLANKIALQRLERLSDRIGIELYPILGVGSAPFRGNLRPPNVEQVVQEYPSTQTFTIQSAFKYDYPAMEVVGAIRHLRETPRMPAQTVDEVRCMEVIQKYTLVYRDQVVRFAKLINNVAAHVPSRRKRKLHIGLFGYSRSVNGISLPRAITFTASLYSLGIPPELIGLQALNSDDIQFLRQTYKNFDKDLADALRFTVLDSPLMTKDWREAIDRLEIEFQPHQEHQTISRLIHRAVRDDDYMKLDELIPRAANLRQFLG
jgi:phosphoenolpyruvate carboxylase